MTIRIETPSGGGGGSGDITDVGDVPSGAAFNGTQGTTLEFISTSTPLTPSAGQMKLYTITTQGHTRPVCLDEDGIEHTLIRDNLRLIRNTSGSTITKGQAVYITGSTGNVPNVSLSKADSLSTLPAVGLTVESTTNNGYGEVIILGELTDINTSAFTSGDRLFVSATTAGALTITRPAYPNFSQRIGSVSVSGVGNGSISVSVAPFIGGEENWTTANNYTVAGTLTALSLISGSDLSVTNYITKLVDGDINTSTDLLLQSVSFIIDGGGSAITSGIKGDLEVPYNCSIRQGSMFVDQSGSITVDIWKDTLGNFPPTDADSITSQTPLAISSATSVTDTALSGWITTINAHDILRFNVDSAATVQRCLVALKVRKT